MSKEIEEVKVGLATLNTLLIEASMPANDKHGVWLSPAKMEMLASEIARYAPELASALASAGKSNLKNSLKRGLELSATAPQPKGAHAMIGFAVKNGRTAQRTSEWMKTLREGEID